MKISNMSESSSSSTQSHSHSFAPILGGRGMYGGRGGGVQRSKIRLFGEDATRLQNAFTDIERIRNMLNPETMQKINAQVKETIQKERIAIETHMNPCEYSFSLK